MLAVGYDDNLVLDRQELVGHRLRQCRLRLIGYGQCNIDFYAKLGLQFQPRPVDQAPQP